MKKLTLIFGLLFIASVSFASEPTTKYRTIPNLTPVASLDTAAERLAAITGEKEVSTGDGNEVEFISIDISDADQSSVVRYILMHITADGDNTSATGFKVWATTGFNSANSVIKFCPISGADQVSPSTTENYILNATTASYTWATMPTSEPGSQNLWPSDEGTSMAISTTSDDVVMFAVYVYVDSEEALGTYKGDASGNELQLNFKYTYEGSSLGGVEYVASSTAYDVGLNTTTTINKPTGTIEDDFMVAQCTGGLYFSAYANVFSAAGWTEIYRKSYTTRSNTVLYRFATASEGSDYTFSHNAGYYDSIIISAFRGVDPVDVLDVAWDVDVYETHVNNDSTPESPDITTVTDGAMIVAGLVYPWNDTDCTVTAPSGYTEIVNLDTSSYLLAQQAMAIKSMATAGLSSPGDWTGSGWNVSQDPIAYVIALKPAEEPDLGPWSATDEIDLKLEVQSFADSIRGLGKNLIWEEQFEGDLTNWTDLSNGGTVELSDNSLHLVSTVAYHADVERAFTVAETDDWIVEFEAAYVGVSKIEILNDSDDQLALLYIANDNANYSTDFATVPSTLSFPNGYDKGKQCIFSYDHTTESVCCFISGASGDAYVLGQIGSAKQITPATNLKIRFTHNAGNTNKLVIGRCIVYHPQLLLIGGSITQGLGAGWVNPPEYWLGRVDGDYTAPFSYQWSKMYSQCWMGNRAFGGSEASSAITTGALTNLLKEKPTHVYISYDHNGIMNGKSFAQVQGYFTTMIDQVHAAGITGKNLIIGNCVATDYLNTEEMQTIRDQENAWLREIQAEEGFTLLDLYTLFVDPTDPDAVNPIYDSGDHVHVNKAGHTLAAETLYDLYENPYSWWFPMLVW